MRFKGLFILVYTYSETRATTKMAISIVHYSPRLLGVQTFRLFAVQN